MKDKVVFTCSVLQALSAFVLMALAVWAAFFTSLPEALFSQLRSEISEAKGEIEDLRRTKNDLEDETNRLKQELVEIGSERDNLASTEMHLLERLGDLHEQTDNAHRQNELLIDHRDNLEKEIFALRSERNILVRSISELQEERALYARVTIGSVISKLSVIADYWLSLYEYNVTIGVRYQEHRQWLNANRELETLRPHFDALGYEEKYGESNEIAVRFRKLQEKTYVIPEIWSGFPVEPILEPSDGNIMFSGRTTQIWNYTRREDKTYREIHNFLINLFFDDTVIERGVVPQTGATFVAMLKEESVFDDLLAEERSMLFDLLDRFLEQNSELGSIKINLTFKFEPTASEIPIEAKKIQHNLQVFREKFEVFMSKIGNMHRQSDSE